MSFYVCWYKSCPEESTTAFELDSRKVFRSLVLKTVDRTVPFFPRLDDMTLHRLGERPPRRVGILRALQLGDLLCAVPALRALRAALPDAEMVLIGLPWARSFVQRFDMYLDGFREFPGYPGLPEQAPRLERIGAFLDEIQAEEFDLVLQMQGSGRITNPLAVLLGADHRRVSGARWVLPRS